MLRERLLPGRFLNWISSPQALWRKSSGNNALEKTTFYRRNFYSCSVYVLQEQQALHYELHKNIALQRRVTLNQAENIRTLKDENAELTKQLADAQGWFPPSSSLTKFRLQICY
jgi:hypothetical protein